MAVLALAACSSSQNSSVASTDPGSVSTPVNVDPVTPVFDVEAWTAANQEDYDVATGAMTRFADAVEDGAALDALDAAATAHVGMEVLAATLDGETLDGAADLREMLLDCGAAYGAVEAALDAADAEALDASTPLFQRCLGISTVTPP